MISRRVEGIPSARSGYVLSETAGAGTGRPSGLIRKGLHETGKAEFIPRTREGHSVRTISPGASDGRAPGDRACRASLEAARGASRGPLGDRCNRRTQVRQPESPVDRAAKRELVSTLNDVFANTSVVVVAHYAGLTVADMQKLRAQMKQAGATVKVAKNRLAKIALEGTDVASISGLMKGSDLIAYSRRSGRGGQGRSRLLQGERQARDPRRSHGCDRSERGRRQGLATLPSSTNCAPSWSVSSRPRRRRSLSSPTRRRRSSPACSEPMPRRAKRREAVPNPLKSFEPKPKDQRNG